MTRLRIFFHRLLGLFLRRKLERELEEEIRSHLDMQIEDNLRQGMSLEDARRAARLRFGGMEQVKEAYWDKSRLGWIENLWQDLRYGTRMLLKKPGFTLIAVITLTLGIGAVTAIFSVVNGVLLKPLPWKEPDRLVMLWEARSHTGADQELVTGSDYTLWKRQQGLIEQIAFWPAWPGAQSFKLVNDDGVDPVPGAFVSSDLFPLLGAKPVVGRAFLPEEDSYEGARVVILGHRLWQERFGGDRNIIGRSVKVDNFRLRDYQVIGVMPPGFDFPGGSELWLSAGSMGVKSDGGGHWFQVLARLKPGVTVERLRAELDELTARSPHPGVESEAGRRVKVAPLLDQVIGAKTRPALLLLLVAVGLLLLIACANVANLLLVRAAARQKEIGIRLALGVGRGRLAQQLLTESVLLALPGGALGTFLAWWGIGALASLSAVNIPRIEEVRVDGSIISFALLVSLLVSVLCGLAPAWRLSGVDLTNALKGTGRAVSQDTHHRRLRNLLVIAEIAVAMILLAGAGLMINSFLRLQRLNPGFRAENLLVAEFKYGGANRALFQQLAARVMTYPNVQAVGGTTRLPLAGGTSQSFNFVVEGRSGEAAQGVIKGDMFGCTPDYFRAMGIPLRRGRFFTEHDGSDAPAVVLISEAMARRHFPQEDPLGKRLTFTRQDGRLDSVWREIIGVVGAAKNVSLEEEILPEVYAPYQQWAWDYPALVVRTSADPQSLATAIRNEVRSISSAVPAPRIRTMPQVMERWTAPPRFRTSLMTLFGAVALALTAIGLYGVMSYAVTQRTQEIGVRLALGAQPRDILKLIIGQGLRLALIGSGIGLAGAMALSRALTSLLFGVSPTDPLTLTVIVSLLTFITLLACLIPARRAARVDPMVALRVE
jgi:predicted permease